MKIKDPSGWSDSFSGSMAGFLIKSRGDAFQERIKHLEQYIYNINPPDQRVFFRIVESATDRTVKIRDEISGTISEVLMFGSNNYLGLANHPHVKERVSACMRDYGVGIAGPPILNGYHRLMKELEERLSQLKKKEDTLIFSSGFATNLGLISALSSSQDVMLYDESSHASFKLGLKLFQGQKSSFKHNNIEHLHHLLAGLTSNPQQTIFIGFEGVYSMDGDLAPVPEIVRLAQSYNAVLIIDDAHGTGVLGEHGGGTTEHFDCEDAVAINMGTFSKCFGVSGGFISSSREIINFFRYSAKPYVFSASLPPITLAAIIGGLEVIENEPWRRQHLLELSQYAIKKLSPLGFCVRPEAAIIAVKKPIGMDIRRANRRLMEMGIFVNTVEYPAVHKLEERFRISISAVHTKSDIDRLVECMGNLFQEYLSKTTPA